MSESPDAILELTVHSAENLKPGKFFGKTKIWIVAWIDPRFKKSTKTLTDSTKNPTFNETFSFPLSSLILQNPSSCITLQVLSSSYPFVRRTKVVGTAILAVAGVGRARETVALQVWRPSGRALGLIRATARIEWYLGNSGSQNCVTGIPVGDGWNLDAEEESGFMPFVPTAPPLSVDLPAAAAEPLPAKRNDVKRNFLLGLIGGAVAAVLVGASAS